MSFDVADNAAHFAGGAILAIPLVVVPSPLASFVVFFVWGLLREQAQSHARGAGFRNNWLHVWSGHKVVEALFWGIGAGVAHCGVYLWLEW